ncbi:TatD family nuclease-associated radical SAM protein [Clostridium sp. AUH-JLR23]|uniref:TatD family nuclease-associated radical SAM protein n=1 Tax=Clostridium sp. AUH-JLR23 TaxID=1505062 RepID=UPI003562BAC7
MILYTIHGNGYQDISELASLEDVTVYVNLTNRCPCACTFCLRQTKEMEEGHSLWLEEEPTVEDVIKEFQKYDLDDFHEVVFCGFGEPLERVEDVIQIAGILKHFRRDLPIRVNTNGLACLIHQRDVTPEFKGRIDTVSISLNAPDAKEYDALTRSRFGIKSFQAMLDFAKSCREYVPFVVMSVVDIIGEEKIKKCQAICDDLGVTLRVRPFEE